MKDLHTSPENCKPNGVIELGSNGKVSYGDVDLEVTVLSNSSSGDLKPFIDQKIGFNPKYYKLVFSGKKEEDDEYLETSAVEENSKVLLLEFTLCQQESPEEVQGTSVIHRGSDPVAEFRKEVDKISDQVAALQAMVDRGTMADDKNIIYLTEMLERLLLKLDGIEAEGEGKVQRKMEVCRVQSLVERMEALKLRNSNPSGNVDNATSASTRSENVKPSFEDANASSPMPSSAHACSAAPYPLPPFRIDFWFLWLLLSVFLFQIYPPILVSSQCLSDQRSLLLQLKNNLVLNMAQSTKVVSWNQTDDCRNWLGITWDSSGHVIGLELDNESITSGIENSSSLFSLQYLQRLNLAFNRLTNTQIPNGISNLTNLVYLNLSNAGFVGQVPVELSKLRYLTSLDLSTQFPRPYPFTIEISNLSMLVQNLSDVRELYLDGVNISTQASDWSQALISLPKLVNLSMRNCHLSGPLDPSLLLLRSLSILRLDRNNLSITVPNFLANFSSLKVLSLSSCSLRGEFPKTIFQAPALENLDLSHNLLLHGTLPQFPLDRPLSVITLTYTNFSGTLPDSIGNLSKLSRLDLSNCNFSGPIPSSIENLTELEYLDFSFNSFSGLVPLFMPAKLTHLDVSRNSLTGPINLIQFERLSKLVEIDFQYNSLNGSIPQSLFGLPSLQKLQLSNNRFSGQLNESSNSTSSNLDTLDLSNNLLEGSIPEYFFSLQKLNVLLLSSNLFNGSMQLEKIQNLQNLTRLELAYNNFSIDTNFNLSVPSFPQLLRLNLASCNLTNFPNLRNQTKMTFLDLSNNKLTGEIPNWVWRIGNGTLLHLNLSYNSLADIEKPHFPDGLIVLDLHSNQLHGNLPSPPASAIYVDYSSNKFVGNIPPDIGSFVSFASFFSLANNNVSGSIPKSLSNATYLQVLDLSGNFLSGEIPPDLLNLSLALGVLNLGRNHISGIIPDTFPIGCALKTLDLSRNKLSGTIPRSLANCTQLEVMNVGINKIQDSFPCMLKESTSLRVLVLRSNQFHGNVSCPGNQSWPNLQIIDIAFNNFTGNVSPSCISRWTGMTLANGEDHMRNHLSFKFLNLTGFYYQDTVTVTIKGLEMVLVKILTVFTSIDLSSNKFEGEIPDSIGELTALYTLNFSHNFFTGNIPKSIGNLTELGSLDLSVNYLSGNIPQELTSLTFLSVLNLSYNNLSGMIPTGPQFQTFGGESYIGNAGLCGYPLNTSCHSSPPPRNRARSSVTAGFDLQFISTGLGYGLGAAIVLAPLALCKEWRDKCDEQLEEFLKMIFPSYGFSYIRCDGKTETIEDMEDASSDDDDDDDDDDEDDDEDPLKSQLSTRRYCVFCTKLDIQFKKIIHNPICTCHYSPPIFSSPPTSSSSCSLLVVYH